MEEDKVKIDLIYTDFETLIPLFWIRNPNPEGPFNFQIYFWNLEDETRYKFSLHFLTYVHNFILRPICCVPDANHTALGWIEGVLPARVDTFRNFLARHSKVSALMVAKLQKIYRDLEPNETLYSKIDQVPTEIIDPYYIFQCLSCGVGRRFYCRNCLHHNIMIAEIMHRPECWTCFSPSIYLTNPIRAVDDQLLFIYLIDLKQCRISMGWTDRMPRSPARTRLQARNRRANAERTRPISLNWGFIELFKHCKNRERIPKLKDYLIFYLVSSYSSVLHLILRPESLPMRLIDDVRRLDKIFDKYTLFR